MSVTASRGVQCSPASSLFSSLKAPDQLLEDRAHPVVIQAGLFDRPVAMEDRMGTQVHVRREELLDQCAESVGLGQAGDLVPELELLQDVLDVR